MASRSYLGNARHRREVGKLIDNLKSLPHVVGAETRYTAQKPVYEVIEAPPGNHTEELGGRTVPSIRVTFPDGHVNVIHFKNYRDFMLWKVRQSRSVGYAN